MEGASILRPNSREKRLDLEHHDVYSALQGKWKGNPALHEKCFRTHTRDEWERTIRLRKQDKLVPAVSVEFEGGLGDFQKLFSDFGDRVIYQARYSRNTSYDFDDSTKYVGQSTDIASQTPQHEKDPLFSQSRGFR